MGKYIVSLDQGTTSSRAILFDAGQRMAGRAAMRHHTVDEFLREARDNPLVLFQLFPPRRTRSSIVRMSPRCP